MRWSFGVLSSHVDTGTQSAVTATTTATLRKAKAQALAAAIATTASKTVSSSKNRSSAPLSAYTKTNAAPAAALQTIVGLRSSQEWGVRGSLYTPQPVLSAAEAYRQSRKHRGSDVGEGTSVPEAVKVKINNNVNKSSGAFYVVLISLLGTGAWLCTNIYNSPESSLLGHI